MKQPMLNPKYISDPTAAMNMALVLMAKAFKLNYSTPTNNNQRISSNPRNRQIAQPGMNIGQDRQMQMVGGKLNLFNSMYNTQYTLGIQNGGKGLANRFIVVLRIANQNVNQNENGNVVAARAKGNGNGNNGNQLLIAIRDEGVAGMPHAPYMVGEFSGGGWMAGGWGSLMKTEEVQCQTASWIGKLQQATTISEKHDPPVVYDSEETLQLTQESRLKRKQLNKEIKPANSAKINQLSEVFVSQKAESREELYFSNTSKIANVSKSISIPNEEFPDDTSPSVA
ncbi:hypothetical protein Tco_0154518 [Tanacetum coccineum]